MDFRGTASDARSCVDFHHRFGLAPGRQLARSLEQSTDSVDSGLVVACLLWRTLMLVLPVSGNQGAGSPISPTLFTQDLSIKTRRREIKRKTWNVIELTQPVIRLWTAKNTRTSTPFYGQPHCRAENRKSGRRDKTKSNLPLAIMNWRFISVLSVSSGCWQWRARDSICWCDEKRCPLWSLLTAYDKKRLSRSLSGVSFAASCCDDRELFCRRCLQTTFLRGHQKFLHDSQTGAGKEKVTAECLQSFNETSLWVFNYHRSNFSYFIVSTIYELNMPFHQSRAKKKTRVEKEVKQRTQIYTTPRNFG